MDNAIDYRAALYKSFELDEHEIREGSKAQSGKTQYFVYVRREAIQHRLDDLFFMQWELTYSDPITTPSFVSVTAAITINGVRKEYNGGARPKGSDMSEDTAKAAYTDAFKRCASMWGIGLYLQNTPQIWTDGYTKGNWDEKRASEDAAWAKFTAWFKGEPAPQQQKPAPQQQKPAAQKPSNVSPMPTQQPATSNNTFACASAYYQKTSQGAYVVFRADHDTNLTATMFGGREKLTEIMGKQWADANGVPNWANGTHKLILPVYVKWTQDDAGNRKVEELKAS